jgi:hypothetical protein
MAQELQNIAIRAPAFKGLNTQDSPIDGDPSFAAVADNCVIDKYGRIGARKGFDVITTDVTALGGEEIRSLGFFEDNDGNTEVFSAGNHKIFKGTTTLTDITPASYTITGDDWKMVAFNNQMYFVQAGHEPLVYDDANGLVKVTAHPSASGTPPNAKEVTAAYGRLWSCGCGINLQTVFWSDLLIGTAWSGGTSGSINLAKVWPDGYDEVQAIAAHNGYLILFGRHSLVVYQGAESPANMVLVDTVANIGCIDRDSVIATGNDLLFLSHVGLQSFSRVIQEKSMPVREISRNVRDDFMSLVNQETTGLRAVYSPENAFYLLYLPTANITYCFDTRGALDDGSLRATRWPSSPFKCFARGDDGTVYVGSANGVGDYSGYQDNGASYNLRYYSNPLTFGDPSRIKFVKKIVPTIIGGSSTTAFIKWGYDFNETYSTFPVAVATVLPAEYGIAEYGIAEYSQSFVAVLKKGINASGQGTVVTIGVEVEIDSEEFSLQEFNIQALLGRMI